MVHGLRRTTRQPEPTQLLLWIRKYHCATSRTRRQHPCVLRRLQKTPESRIVSVSR
jgi:hypothetical protein